MFGKINGFSSNVFLDAESGSGFADSSLHGFGIGKNLFTADRSVGLLLRLRSA